MKGEASNIHPNISRRHSSKISPANIRFLVEGALVEMKSMNSMGWELFRNPKCTSDTISARDFPMFEKTVIIYFSVS